MLVGRTSQLRALGARLEAARAGCGSLALLAGEAGIGKTRLATEVADRALQCEISVQWVRWRPMPGAPAYWAWLPALRAVLGECNQEALAAGDQVALAQLAVILPALRDRLPDLPPPGQVEPPLTRFLLSEAVVHLLAKSASRRPLLLVADDLHEAERESLLLLEVIAAAVAALPVLVVATYRDYEAGPGSPLAQSLAALLREPSVERIALGALDAEAIAAIVHEARGEPGGAEVTDAIVERSAGNPFFARELALSVAEPASPGDGGARPRLPASVQHAVGERLARLSPPCRTLLEHAAVLGGDFELEAIQAVSHLGAALASALDEALAARVLTETGDVGEYRFAHPLFLEVAYGSIGGGRRMQLHQEAARELRALYGDEDEGHVEQIAHHLRLAAPLGEFDAAIDYLERAARRLWRELAFERSVQHYRWALEQLERARPADRARRARLLLGLGLAMAAAIDAGGTREDTLEELQARLSVPLEDMRTASELALEGGQPELAGEAVLHFASHAIGATGGAVAPSLAPLVERVIDAQTEAKGALAARLAAELPFLWPFLSEARRSRQSAREMAEHALQLARDSGDGGALASALLAAARVAVNDPGRISECAELASELVSAGAAAGDAGLTNWGLIHQMQAAKELGDTPGLDRALDAIERHARQHRLSGAVSGAIVNRVWRELLLGRFEQAQALMERGYAGDGPVIRNRHAGLVACLHIARGELQALPRPVLDTFRDNDFSGVQVVVARLAVAAGDYESARDLFEDLAEGGFQKIERDWDRLPALAWLAEICVALQDRARAEEILALLAPYGGRNCGGGTPGPAGASARHQGMLTALLDRREEAARYFEQALELNARIGARPALAVTQAEYAALLSERGRRADYDRAAAMLSSAAATAEELGMRPLAERVAALRQRLRASPRAAYPAGLTRREVEVLRLIADGRNNAEIAEALVLSVRTVERHITNLYTKIDARGRADATAFALRHDLVPLAAAPARTSS